MISSVVLSHNDSAILSRCLTSLGWCDEVIVVDDNSTDGTIDVARKLGAKAFFHPLNDDFAAQRNFGLEKAKGEWILFVDSDEVVTEELASEIRTILSSRAKRGDLYESLEIASPSERSRNDNVSGYYIKRKDFLWGRELTHGETGSVKLLRLAKKNVGKWLRPVHEEWKIRGKVGTLTHPLLHYPHQNVAQFLEKINRYSTLYARYLHSQGVKEPVWQIIGKPMPKFFVNYVWRLGFLDGTAGIVVALMMSFHSFLVRAKLWFLWRFSF